MGNGNGKPWFKPKRTGYGCVPSTPEGWVITGVYVMMLLSGEVALFLTGPTESHIIAFLTFSLLLTAVFLAVAYKKTDGVWRWRRNGQPE